MDTRFAFFDEDGKQDRDVGQEAIQTATQLDYIYDDEPVGAVGAMGTSGSWGSGWG